MNSKDYWKRRQLEREQKFNDLISRDLDRIIKFYYEQSLLKIQKDIAALYAQYAVENKLSMSEAKRLIRGSEFSQWRMTLQEYVKAAKNDSDILKELNTLAMRSRISRIEALHARTMMEVADLCEKMEKWQDAFQYRAYIEHLYGNLYDYHKTIGLNTPPVAVDKKHVEEILTTPWSGKNYSQRIWNNGRKLERAIQSTMIQAIHRGSSIQKLSKDLSERMNVAYHNAERLVRTELNYIENRAAGDAIKEADLGFYQFVATLDNRTTPMCQSLDGRYFPIEEMNQGENAPPMHVRCRSTIIGSLDDGKSGRIIKGNRAATDENGKRIKIPAEMNYSDWKKVYIDKTQTLDDWRKTKEPPKPKTRNEKDIRADYDSLMKQYRLAEKEHEKAKLALEKANPIWYSLTDKERAKLNNRFWDTKVAMGDINEKLKPIRIEGAKQRVIFASELGKMYDKADIAAIIDKVKDAPENVRILWNLAEGDMKVLSKTYTGGASHYSPRDRAININLYKDTVTNISNYGFPAYKTTFHELGHLIDHWMQKSLTYQSRFFKNGALRDSLKNEAAEYVNDTWQKLKADAITAGKSAKSIKKADAYNAVSQELKNLQDVQQADVSDIFGGATGLKAQGYWGHKAAYWKNGDELPLEAFAEMFSATLCCPESLAQIRKYFPKSYKIFEEMVDDFVGGAI